MRRTVLLAMCALLSVAAFSQSEEASIGRPNPPSKNGPLTSYSVSSKEVQFELKGDTLIIPYYYPLYKYIQIGGRTYKIEAPTLTEQKPEPAWRTLRLGELLFNGGSIVPAINSDVK